MRSSRAGPMIDHRILKGRPPFPFETIAVAVAFSPRLGAVLAEAARLAETFQAQLLLIHVGKKTAGKEAIIEELRGSLGIDRESRMLWLTGDPVASLLAGCKENLVDLLVLGALRQETVFRYYLGSVARGMSRRAKCSLLLLTEPTAAGTSFERIVVGCVDHVKTVATLNTAIYLARQVKCREMRLVREIDQAVLTMAMSDDSTTLESNRIRAQLLHEEEVKLQELTGGCDTAGIVVSRRVLFGRPGFSLRQYAADCRADLLAINSPDSRYGIMDRIFSHDMEHILEHLPCNILIVHSRLPDGS
jgi:nucleotide-binding universal stress UspA family protein